MFRPRNMGVDLVLQAMRRVTGRLHLFACMLAGGAVVTTACAAEPLVVQVVPQFPVEEIYRTWSPILAKISEATGIALKLEIAKSIPEFEQNFVKGIPDVAYMNPYHAVIAKRAVGYEPIICDSSKQLTGILVVSRDSPVRTIGDLSRKDIAFPSPNSFGASLYLRAILTERENLTFSSRFVGTHSNVYRLVAGGRVAAGGGIRQTLERDTEELRSQLRIVYETPATNPHPIVVHPRVPPALRAKLQEAFMALARVPSNAMLLEDIQMSQPRLASSKDYMPIERLGLDKYAAQPTN